MRNKRIDNTSTEENTIASDKPVRTHAMFGTFSGHVNITDGHYVYMRAPEPDKTEEIFNYTLMPLYMDRRFEMNELKDVDAGTTTCHLIDSLADKKNVK